VHDDAPSGSSQRDAQNDNLIGELAPNVP